MSFDSVDNPDHRLRISCRIAVYDLWADLLFLEWTDDCKDNQFQSMFHGSMCMAFVYSLTHLTQSISG